MPVVFDTYRTRADRLYMLVELPEAVDRDVARDKIAQLSWVMGSRLRQGRAVRTLMVHAYSDNELTDKFSERIADVMEALKDLSGIDGTFVSHIAKN